ncbi:MAG: mechanosensitive ion channel domain-containing protein [Pseudomonadota bacterium]
MTVKDSSFITITSDIMHGIWSYPILSVGASNIRVSNVVLALLLSALGFKYAKSVLNIIKKNLRKRMADDKDAANALEKIISYAICAIYIISVLEIANVPLSSFAFVGGALALGIGLGGQNLMSSLISSLIIMIERPIKIGDIVEIDGMTGRVTSIGARCIGLTSFSNVEILVPNNKVMQNVVVNWTFADYMITINAVLSITKATHADDSREFIKGLIKTLQSTPEIFPSPPPEVHLVKVSSTHYVYQLNFSFDLKGKNGVEAAQSIVNLKLVDFLKDKDFEIEYLKLVPVNKEPKSTD